MAYTLVILITACLISFTAALSPVPSPAATYERPINQDCVNTSASVVSSQSVRSSLDYFPSDYLVVGEAFTSQDHVTVTFAQGFEVEYYDAHKVVRNTLENETYILYQCGLPPPALSNFPEGSKLFSIPLDSVAVLETVPLAFMSALGVDARIQSVSSYAVGACGQKLLTCPGRSAPSLDTVQAPANAASLLAPLAPLADAIATSAAYPVAQTFAFSASMDPGVLRRAEWIKFLGLFFNMDAESSELFAAINESYYQTQGDVSARRRAEAAPVLAFVDYLDYDPDQAYEVQFAPYKLQYTEDAGAAPPDYDAIAATPGVVPSPYATNGSTLWFSWGNEASFPSQEAALAAFQDFLTTVDIVVDETYALDPTAYDLPAFLATFNITHTSDFRFLTSDQVYREDGLVGPAPNYGLDWFEGAIVRPDLVLSDFAAAVSPADYPNHKPTWIRNVARGDQPVITTSQNCNAITSCTPEPAPICPYIRSCPDGTVAQQLAVNTTCVYAACS